MIILDAQPVSQLQRAGSSDAARIEQRINAYSAQDVWITVITPFEQFKGCIAAISAAKAQRSSCCHLGFCSDSSSITVADGTGESYLSMPPRRRSYRSFRRNWFAKSAAEMHVSPPSRWSMTPRF